MKHVTIPMMICGGSDEALRRGDGSQSEYLVSNLVLSDVMMPRLNGFGLLSELRADPALGSVPIILLSARAGEEARIEGVTGWRGRLYHQALQPAGAAGARRFANPHGGVPQAKLAA
jgi:CheY-like chemotaxis protein